MLFRNALIILAWGAVISVAAIVHLVLHLAVWQRRQVARPPHPELLVLNLDLFKLGLVFGDGHVHELDLFPLLVVETFLEARAVLFVVVVHQHDLSIKLVLPLAHVVDRAQQSDIVLHQTVVVLTVLLQVARQLATVVADLGLVGCALPIMGFVLVNVGLLAVRFLENPGLVEADHTLLQLLVVLNVLDDLEDVILEPLLVDQLNIKSVTAAQVLVLETLVTHLQVIHDQVKIITDALEVFHFDLHLVHLLVEGGDVVLTRQDIALQLLDLVIEDEFELFELLGLLLEFDDAAILVFDRRSSRLELSFLSLDLVFEVVDGDVEGARLACLLLDFFGKSASVQSGRSELASLFLEFALVLHTFLDDGAELVFVAVLELIDLFPSVVFNLLSAVLVLLFELFDLALLLFELLLFLEFLELVLLVHLCLVLILGQEKLLDVSFEVKFLLFLGLQEESLALLIIAHLLHVLLLLETKLLLVDLLQVVLLLLGLLLNLLLLISELLCGELELHLLLFNALFELSDLVIVSLHRVLELLLASLLLQLNVGLEALDARLDEIQGALLDQDLAVQDVRHLHTAASEHAEAAEGAVDANREQLAVVVVEAHALDLSGVGLHLKHLLHVLLSVTENLN